MGDIPEDEVLTRLEELLENLSDTQASLQELEGKAEAERKAIATKFGPPIDTLTTKREAIMAEITVIFDEHRASLLDDGGKPRKSVLLRGGELFARFTPEALEVDETKIEKALRKIGEWRNHSKQPKRTFSKTALKNNPAVVAKLPDEVARFTRTENLIVKLPKLNLELKHVINPLRSRLAKPEST